MYFEIIGEIEKIKEIAAGGRIRDVMRIQKQFGSGRRRKLKGFAMVGSRAARSARLSSTGMKPTVSVGRR